MLTHLRLARARGSLRAPNSLVQDRALAYLDMLAEYAKGQARRDMVKALLTHKDSDYDEVKFQFPEYFDADPFEQIRTEDGYDIDRLDDSQVQWGVAGEDEDEALSRWIAEQDGGTFTGADFE